MKSQIGQNSSATNDENDVVATSSARWVLASGEEGWKTTPPKISGTTERMTMKFFADVKYYREARNAKLFFDITHLVLKLWVRKFKKGSNSLFSASALFGHASFTKFCRINDIDVRN